MIKPMEIGAKVHLQVFLIPYSSDLAWQYYIALQWTLPIISSDLGHVNGTQRTLTRKQRDKRCLLLRKWFPESRWPWPEMQVLLLGCWTSYFPLLSCKSLKYIPINWNKPELMWISCNLKCLIPDYFWSSLNKYGRFWPHKAMVSIP